MKKLEAVYLTDCTLDDEAAAAIGTNAEGLRILCMENCTGVENYQFLSALEKLENLAKVISESADCAIGIEAARWC